MPDAKIPTAKIKYRGQTFRDVLMLHAAWLDGKGGERAELKNGDFTHADLHNANLRQAILSECSFFEADLSHADLSEAVLENATLAMPFFPAPILPVLNYRMLISRALYLWMPIFPKHACSD